MEFIPKSLRTMWIKGPNASFARVRFWNYVDQRFQTQASPKSITMYGVNVSYAKALTSLKELILPKKNDFDSRFSELLKNYTADLLSYDLFEKSTKFPIYNRIKSIRLLFDLTLTGG
ncbi:hypothetical protein BLOT_008095 [Blomia tropicalis]|nr:hypothetical protein BLOT_008095 [Blomia tropicalis]